MQHEYIQTNGIRLHYVTAGEGPLLLFLHGFPEFWYCWRHQIEEFSKDYKVVAIDMRGYNESDKPEEASAYAMSELTKDVEGVITGLGYEKCVLVGHDWGGAVAWSFAYTYPHLLDKLIILNLPHPAKFAAGLRTPQQLLKSWYIGLFQLPGIPELLLSANHYAALRRLFQKSAINPDTFSEADLDALVTAAAKPGALTSMLNYYRQAFGANSSASREWEVLQVPTLMIWGENDAALGKELTYGTEELVADFRIHYIPNCSHWVQEEQPTLVNQHMRSFL